MRCTAPTTASCRRTNQSSLRLMVSTTCTVRARHRSARIPSRVPAAWRTNAAISPMSAAVARRGVRFDPSTNIRLPIFRPNRCVGRLGAGGFRRISIDGGFVSIVSQGSRLHFANRSGLGSVPLSQGEPDVPIRVDVDPVARRQVRVDTMGSAGPPAMVVERTVATSILGDRNAARKILVLAVN